MPRRGGGRAAMAAPVRQREFDPRRGLTLDDREVVLGADDDGVVADGLRLCNHARHYNSNFLALRLRGSVLENIRQDKRSDIRVKAQPEAGVFVALRGAASGVLFDLGLQQAPVAGALGGCG